MKYTIDTKECVACGYCELICPVSAILYFEEGNYYQIDADACKGCGHCADGCILDIIHPVGEGARIAQVHIIEEKCIGCTLCKRVCPVGAIDGAVKQVHTIRLDKCIRCGDCATKCKPNAIEITYY